MDLPDHVELASPGVELDGVSPHLMELVAALGYLHHILFELPLIITSGTDGRHAQGSAHYKGRAVDVRIVDLPPLWQTAFVLVAVAVAQRYGVGVFDERALPGAPHLHLEYLGA